MGDESIDSKIEDFYRLRFLCRPGSMTRIREIAVASSASGWPDNDRDIRLRRERRVPAFGGWIVEVSNSGSASPQLARGLTLSKTTVRAATACPTSPQSQRTLAIPVFGRQVGQGGVTWRLRSSMCSKIICACRRRRRLSFFATDGSSDHFQASQQRPQRRRSLNSSKRG
jgi:hypothetical protein